MKPLALRMLRWYQGAVSTALPPSCRFEPSCSHFSYQAIDRHGLFRGSWLTFGRLLRCHPFHAGGYDPVP